eukprot:COSAG01_NODE_2453_length_7674_cov_13.713003_2_plen_235_part_00
MFAARTSRLSPLEAGEAGEAGEAVILPCVSPNKPKFRPRQVSEPLRQHICMANVWLSYPHRIPSTIDSVSVIFHMPAHSVAWITPLRLCAAVEPSVFRIVLMDGGGQLVIFGVAQCGVDQAMGALIVAGLKHTFIPPIAEAVAVRGTVQLTVVKVPFETCKITGVLYVLLQSPLGAVQYAEGPQSAASCSRQSRKPPQRTTPTTPCKPHGLPSSKHTTISTAPSNATGYRPAAL